MKKKMLNPLRYPGSKASFVSEIKAFLYANALEGYQIVEPYAGSASMSFGLLHDNVVSSAMLFERDPLVFAFWHCVFNRTEDLIKAVEAVPVTLDTWHAFANFKEQDDFSACEIVEMGLAGLFFNRTNFSGVIHAGPIGGQNQSSAYDLSCRFNKPDLIARIEFAASFSDKVEIYFGDAMDALVDANKVENGNRFFYVDPPYYLQGRKLYRYHYTFTDHKRLSDTLAAASYRWILSYDNHPVIDHLYSNFNRVTKAFRYSSKAPKNEHELVITNIGLPDDVEPPISSRRSNVTLESSFEADRGEVKKLIIA